MSDKSRLADLVLCLFFGIFGAHKFYEGKSGMGVLYLLTSGLWGIGVLVDLFKIIFGMATDAEDYEIKRWRNNRFFNLSKYYLPPISFAMQLGCIIAIVHDVQDGSFQLFHGSILGSFFSYLIVAAFVYAPLVFWCILNDFDMSEFGVGDWFILLLHLPLFAILLILLIIGFIGKHTLENVPASSESKKVDSDKKYYIDKNDTDVLGNYRVKDEFGNTVDHARPDYSGQGDYKGSDGSTIYNEKDSM